MVMDPNNSFMQRGRIRDQIKSLQSNENDASDTTKTTFFHYMNFEFCHVSQHVQVFFCFVIQEWITTN